MAAVVVGALCRELWLVVAAGAAGVPVCLAAAAALLDLLRKESV